MLLRCTSLRIQFLRTIRMSTSISQAISNTFFVDISARIATHSLNHTFVHVDEAVSHLSLIRVVLSSICSFDQFACFLIFRKSWMTSCT